MAIEALRQECFQIILEGICWKKMMRNVQNADGIRCTLLQTNRHWKLITKMEMRKIMMKVIYSYFVQIATP